MTDWSKVKIRCSAIGLIMTEPKSAEDKKAGNLSATAKTYLKKVYAEVKYGRKEDFTSKYTDKGNLAEEDCITLLSRLDKKLYKKNDQRLQNEFLTGELDIYEGEHILKAEYVIDNKASWSLFTFLAVLGEKLDPKYDGQVQGYMALTGAPKGEVSYCLVNTPEEIILEEKKKLLFKMNAAGKAGTEYSPAYVEACLVLEKNMLFNDIAMEDRRIKFEITRDDAYITRVYEMVKKCRLYLAEIEELHLNGRPLPVEEKKEIKAEEIVLIKKVKK